MVFKNHIGLDRHAPKRLLFFRLLFTIDFRGICKKRVSQKDQDTLFRLYIYALTDSYALYFVSALKADSLLGQPPLLYLWHKQ